MCECFLRLFVSGLFPWLPPSSFLYQMRILLTIQGPGDTRPKAERHGNRDLVDGSANESLLTFTLQSEYPADSPQKVPYLSIPQGSSVLVLSFAECGTFFVRPQEHLARRSSEGCVSYMVSPSQPSKPVSNCFRELKSTSSAQTPFYQHFLSEGSQASEHSRVLRGESQCYSVTWPSRTVLNV